MARADEGIPNLYMEKSWLSDHPLVSTDIEIKMNETEAEKIAKGKARLAKIRGEPPEETPEKSFKIQVGVFNVLSLFASQIGKNSNLVGEKKFFNDALYKRLMRKLLGIPDSTTVTRETYTREEYKTKKETNLEEKTFEELCQLIIQNLPEESEQKSKCEETMNAYLQGLKVENTQIQGIISSSSEQDGESFKLNLEENIDIEQIQRMGFKEKLRYVLLMGDKVNNTVLPLSLKIQYIHKSMIDNVLGTNTMGGFEYTKDSGLLIEQERYVQSKLEFVRSVIQNFFTQRTPQGGEYDAKILVCAEFDLGDVFVSSILDIRSQDYITGLNGIKVGYPNTKSIEASSLKKNERNFGRYVFYQGEILEEQENSYSELDMFYNTKKKKKNTVSKLKFELTQREFKIPLVVYAVHLDSTTMDTYLDIQHEDFYKKRYETAQLLQHIMEEQQSKDLNTVTLIAGDFNCDFSETKNISIPIRVSGVKEKKHEYFRSYNSAILQEETNYIEEKTNVGGNQILTYNTEEALGNEDITAYRKEISVCLSDLVQDITLQLQPLIGLNEPGTLKKRKFGFINAQADKGETTRGTGRSYPSDNVVLLNFGNQQNFTVSSSNGKVTTDLNLTLGPDPKIYYPLFKAKTPQGGGSRKRNRKRNKKSLKKRNKRKSSRKKSKNPRKKRSKRR